jgi:hypothetical protein
MLGDQVRCRCTATGRDRSEELADGEVRHGSSDGRMPGLVEQTVDTTLLHALSALARAVKKLTTMRTPLVGKSTLNRLELSDAEATRHSPAAIQTLLWRCIVIRRRSMRLTIRRLAIRRAGFSTAIVAAPITIYRATSAVAVCWRPSAIILPLSSQGPG